MKIIYYGRAAHADSEYVICFEIGSDELIRPIIMVRFYFQPPGGDTVLVKSRNHAAICDRLAVTSRSRTKSRNSSKPSQIRSGDDVTSRQHRSGNIVSQANDNSAVRKRQSSQIVIGT